MTIEVQKHPSDWATQHLPGCWYVVRSDEEADEYLHSDGVWRSGALRRDGAPTGYYATEEEARAALAKSRRE